MQLIFLLIKLWAIWAISFSIIAEISYRSIQIKFLYSVSGSMSLFIIA